MAWRGQLITIDKAISGERIRFPVKRAVGEGEKGMEAGGGGRVVGEYLIGKQIGSGAFSVVWLGRHRGGGGGGGAGGAGGAGGEVAVKEMALDRLNKKLRESLLSEVSILRRIHHPNIIALFDFIPVLNTIYYFITNSYYYSCISVSAPH